MTLTESIRSNWSDITTGKLLRGAILHAARRLDAIGYPDLAGKWRDRVAKMPRQNMSKEAINVVLMSACFELDGLGIDD